MRFGLVIKLVRLISTGAVAIVVHQRSPLVRLEQLTAAGNDICVHGDHTGRRTTAQILKHRPTLTGHGVRDAQPCEIKSILLRRALPACLQTVGRI